jgi:chromosome segregation ATPase
MNQIHSTALAALTSIILDLEDQLELEREAAAEALEHDLSSMAENADEAEDQVERLTAALEDERSKVSKWNDKFQSRIGILGDRNTRQAETLAWDAEKITELESENAELRTTLVNHIEQLAEKMEYTDELENLVARNNLQIKNLKSANRDNREADIKRDRTVANLRNRLDEIIAELDEQERKVFKCVCRLKFEESVSATVRAERNHQFTARKLLIWELARARHIHRLEHVARMNEEIPY